MSSRLPQLDSRMALRPPTQFPSIIMLAPIILIALLLAILQAASAAPSSAAGTTLQPRLAIPSCFPDVHNADLPHAFDAGQTPAKDFGACRILAWQARKMAAVWREDQKMCYFKAFPQNGGAKTYHRKYPADRPLGAFDIPGYDDRSYKTRDEARDAGCEVYVENAGRVWCKTFPRCDKCTLILPRLDFVGCDKW